MEIQKMRKTFRNELKQTLRKMHTPSQNKAKFIYKAMAPDNFQKSQPARRILREDGNFNLKSYHKQRGQVEAQTMIADIYDVKLC